MADLILFDSNNDLSFTDLNSMILYCFHAKDVKRIFTEKHEKL